MGYIYKCSNCGSTNVEMKAWVNPNNDNSYVDTVSDGEAEDNYCSNCDGHYKLDVIKEPEDYSNEFLEEDKLLNDNDFEGVNESE